MLRPSATMLALAALLAAACGETTLVERTRQPLVDDFQQIQASSIDILLVVDNSGSMRPHREALSANFDRFLDLLDPDPTRSGEKGEIDYRLALTTPDGSIRGGKIVGNPAIVRPGDYDTIAAFRANLDALKGEESTADEQGLAGAQKALETLAKMKDDKGKQAFLRDGAYLYIIVISDEEDGSFGEVHYFHRYFKSLKGVGNENTVAVSAIAGVEGCKNSEPGERYREITRLTGGVFGDICTEDWGSTLRELAVSGIGLRKRFQLREVPGPNDSPSAPLPWQILSLEVRYPCDTPDDDPHLDEGICSQVLRDCSSKEPAVICTPWIDELDGWLFDPIENAIVFDGAAIPGAGSTIRVRYFPRD